ncbi:hypothetical protein UF75_3792 [Desulfosporosinus sp. I2]|uniref:type II secretion system F family protein n=1 Tax=Desulfosporosinus sp. I2 TaxID=1617025 RepID=UPI0005EEEA58|nr:hypothetical protein [Desulfosporosinus sp. I2]KJR45807.1 hypothetical protein UF75_3792 [Desulfosporosinus sp. I2]
MNNFAIYAAISFTVYTFIRFGISEEEVRRAEVFGNTRQPLKEKLLHWMGQNTSYGLRARLSRLGVPMDSYLKMGSLMSFSFALLLGIAGQSLIWALIGAVVAYGIHWLRYYAMFNNWRNEMLSEVGNLASLLKIRLIVGDTVSQAIPSILPVLHGALKVAWTGLNTEIAGGVPIPEALDRLADKVSDRDMSAILLKLKTYHREGVPLDHLGHPDPFGDMAAKIERSAAKRVKYATKKMTGPLTIITGVGFITVTLWIIPYFWKIISESFSQL